MIVKILLGIVIFIITIIVLLLQPYMKYSYVRTSNTPTTIIAEFYTVTDDALCTQFYKIEEGKLTNKGIFPNMPNDIPDPHLSTEFKDGDRISLTGFSYEWWATNILTGRIQKRSINMIDVISWESSNSTFFKSENLDLSPTTFKHENYVNCRP